MFNLNKKLSVIISNRNDSVMLAVTIRSVIEELRPLNFAAEIIIVDNSDPGAYEMVAATIPQKYLKEHLIKVYRQDYPCLFTARETAAAKASTPYILCLDSHMLVGHNMIYDLYNFITSPPTNNLAFAHAPICWAHHHHSNSRHDRDMTECELGGWNKHYNYSRPITWKGMPWICSKDFFLNTLNGYGALADHRISWGGGDMHIGVKPWLLGYENWAVPTSPGIHIGPFPKLNKVKNQNHAVVHSYTNPTKYRLYADSGNYPPGFGFLISCYVLGGEPMIQRNLPTIQERFGSDCCTEELQQKAIELGTSERQWLLNNQKLSFEELLQTTPWEVPN